MIDAPETIFADKEFGHNDWDAGTFCTVSDGGTEYTRADVAQARIAELEGVVRWYGEQARLARLIHSEGDEGRHAIHMDGGSRSRAALKAKP
jgi:hypothetical protein